MENIWEGPDMIQIEGGKTEVEHRKKNARIFLHDRRII